MKKEKVIVELNIEDKLTVEIEGCKKELEGLDRFDRMLEESRIQKQAILDDLQNMSGGEIKELITTRLQNFTISDTTKVDIVLDAIDAFDPIAVVDDEPGEYDVISYRIIDRIEVDMSVEEIAAAIAEEFNYSFEMGYTSEYCMRPAKKIHYYLN